MGSTILLADKSVTIQKIVELTFADQNFVIKSFSDGQAALDAVPQLRPDIILADISLPVRNGYDVCRTLRMEPSFAEFSSVPVILLAGIYETMDDERARQVDEKAKEAGATELMSKPFDPQILTTKVAELLGKNRQPTGDEPTTIFAAPLDVSANRPIASVDEPPADDSERTMMLPKSVLMQNMFADAPVLAESAPATSSEASPEPAPPRAAVDVAAISPAYEPVFDSEEDFGASEQPDSNMSLQENEQEMEGEPSILVPPTEDPFAEVFEEPQSHWSASSASEEESPFGVPEAPHKEAEATVNTQPVSIPEPEEIEAATTSAIAEEPAMDSSLAEAPTVEPPSVEPEVESVVLDSPAPEPVAEETYEDTWPGVIVPGHQPVEELFEPEASPLPIGLEETDLEPDLTEEAEAEEPQAPASAAQTVQLTDDLVERIAERVVQKLSERVVSEIVWQVVPDLAEKMIRRELEKLHAGEE